MQSWIDQYWWTMVIGAVWEFGWKGWALWRAAQNKDKAWFILLLIVNSLAVLPIAYIFIFSKHVRPSGETVK